VRKLLFPIVAIVEPYSGNVAVISIFATITETCSGLTVTSSHDIIAIQFDVCCTRVRNGQYNTFVKKSNSN